MPAGKEPALGTSGASHHSESCSTRLRFQVEIKQVSEL